jgi:hypothetical protein
MQRVISILIDIGEDSGRMSFTFKQIEDCFSDLTKIHEKFEKPLTKLSGYFKKYASLTAEIEQDSPFYELAIKYDELIEGNKQFIAEIADNIIVRIQEIIKNSEMLNDDIKEMNSNAKIARKIENKISKLEDDIKKLNLTGKHEKAAQKENEKRGKEEEFKLAKNELSLAKMRFDNTFSEFGEIRDQILKNFLTNLVKAEKEYMNIKKEVINKADYIAELF